MDQLTQQQCREKNSDKLKNDDLWITGDGTPFPATKSGLDFASKWRRKNGLSLFYCKKSPKATTAKKSGDKKNSNKK